MRKMSSAENKLVIQLIVVVIAIIIAIIILIKYVP
jgi:hypothetical protein